MLVGLVVALLLIWVCTGAFATRSILRDGFSSNGQRLAQAAIAWLIPILGGFLVLLLTREQMSPTGRPASGGQDLSRGDVYGGDLHDGGGYH